MNTRNSLLFVAVAAVLGAPAVAGAQALSFNYLEVNYVDVDVDYSDSVIDNGFRESVSTGSDSGFQIGGSVEVWEGLHLFGEYSKAGQDLRFLEESTFGDRLDLGGDFDVERWRLGVGYALPATDTVKVYGRLSWDKTEFKDLSVAGIPLGSADDDGLGAEFGALIAVTPRAVVQPYLRYTSVGEFSPRNGNGNGNGDDDLDDIGIEATFDSDVLVGVAGRWFFTDQFAVQASYEYGEIKTWGLGVRLAF
jgi:hypothetical protein